MVKNAKRLLPPLLRRLRHPCGRHQGHTPEQEAEEAREFNVGDRVMGECRGWPALGTVVTRASRGTSVLTIDYGSGRRERQAAGLLEPHLTVAGQLGCGSYEKLDLFVDYLELVVQFGFMTLFAVAFPFAATIAFVSNLIEIRADAQELLTGTRRPFYKVAEDIGSWKAMLEGMSYMSVVTNSAIVGFVGTVMISSAYDAATAATRMSEDADSTTDPSGNMSCVAETTSLASCRVVATNGTSPEFMAQPHRYRDYRLWLVVIGIEHVVLIFKMVLAAAIPDETHETSEAVHGMNYFKNLRGWR